MNALKKFYIRQQFLPGIAGIFLNPFYLIRKDLLDIFKEFIPRLHGNILDYGCGRKPYQSLFQVDSYTGADMENEGHSHENEDIDIYFDGKTLPVEDNRFDAVFSSEVFEHVFEPEISLGEVRRVLKPGGLFLLSVPFVWNEHEVPNDYARYSSFGMPYLLKKQGFEIVEIRKSGNFVRVISQLRILYLYRRFEMLPVPLRIFSGLFVFSPLTLLGIVFSAIFPKDKTMFFNLVILARKTA